MCTYNVIEFGIMVVSYARPYAGHHLTLPDFMTFLQWLLSEHIVPNGSLLSETGNKHQFLAKKMNHHKS